MNARTWFAASLIALAALAAPAAHAQPKAPPRDPNPTHDPDVQAGYDRTRQEILDRRSQEGTSNGTSTAPSGTDRSEHDHGHQDCRSAGVCSDQATYKDDGTTPPPRPNRVSG
ncbi:MAG: hypothetical protein JOZ90_02375 [Alphaproteobacteria bacterium]|nr:hypothetical protein [Alphaproteobacteria bacterium]MBV9371192.1 hypothetical protein [Alphaproteobacteria bacterium]MBV9899922.1 hypothetical protein [Alphaproteobacteria bacterium]